MSEVILNDANFATEVLKSDLPVLVDFYADWCVAPKAKILLGKGSQVLAKQIRKSDILVGLGKRKIDSGQVSYSSVTVNGGHCRQITVETGRTVKVTDDHPLYTPRGWKTASALKIGDKVAVYPVGEAVSAVKNINEEKEVILARLSGLLFTDGTLYYQPRNRYWEVSFSVGQMADIEQLRQDLKILGFPRIHVREITKEQEISGRKFKTHLFKGKCLSKDLFTLLAKRGVPVGAKKSQHYLLPSWIKNSPAEVKRQFLASFLGGDGPKVDIRLVARKEGQSYNCLNINDIEFHKNSDLEHSGLELAKELAVLFEEFGAKVGRIYAEKDGYVRLDGQKSSIVHLQFKHDFATGYALSQRIGFSYCQQKKQVSEVAGEFLREILYQRQIWIGLYKKAKRFSLAGHGYRYISKTLRIHPSQAWSWIKGKAKATIAHHGLKFNIWKKERLEKVPRGFLWEKVVEVKPVFLPAVAKISVESTHSFIANGFLSHNCGPCKMIEPVIEEIAQEYNGKLKVGKLNVDENQKTASSYGVMSIPSLLIFKSGQVVATLVGFRSKEKLVEEINKQVCF